MLKLCAVIALSLCIVGSAYGQQTDPDPPVCDRTMQVQNQIVFRVLGIGANVGSVCRNITSEQLASITDFVINRVESLTELKPGDLNDLTGINLLAFTNTGLQTLPAGIFNDIPQTAEINLDSTPLNEGLPRTLVEDLKARLADGAAISTDILKVQGALPAHLELTVENSSTRLNLADAFVFFILSSVQSADSYQTSTNPEGIVELSVIGDTMTVQAATAGQTVINIIARETSSGAGRRAEHTVTVTSTYDPSLDPMVCDRTLHVRDAITAAVGNALGRTIICQNITFDHLTTIEFLYLDNSGGAVGIVGLKADDFRGLTGLSGGSHPDNGLNLTGNSLQTLPAGIFEDVPQGARISMTGNPFGEGLPLALVNDLKRRVRADAIILTDFLKVQDVLSTQLELSVGETETLDLEDAFACFELGTFSPADSYEIMVANPAVVEATVVNHRMTIAGLAGGETEIQIVGIRGEQTVTHRLTVSLPADPPVCDRTSQVGKAISTATSVADCGAVTVEHLAQTTVLDASSIDITRLRSGDFNDLISLERLDLSDNQLQTLPADIFDGLTNLAELDLGGNQLRTLPAGIFDDLTGLATLNLAGNPFGDGLPPAVIEGLKDARNINVSLDLVAVIGALPTVRLPVDDPPKDVDLRDAFVRAGGGMFGPAEDYEITADGTAALSRAVGSHTLTIATSVEEKTEIEVVGIFMEQRATQTFTVTTADDLVFRIKVFLEGAQ